MSILLNPISFSSEMKQSDISLNEILRKVNHCKKNNGHRLCIFCSNDSFSNKWNSIASAVFFALRKELSPSCCADGWFIKNASTGTNFIIYYF